MLLGVKFTVFLNKIEGVKIYILFLHTLPQSKSFYKIHAVSYFYKTEVEIWAGFELAGSTENSAKIFYFSG
jgi:hypothetical protein